MYMQNRIVKKKVLSYAWISVTLIINWINTDFSHYTGVFACRCQYGTTPLIWGARKDHYDCVMHLLENGANVDQEGAVRTFFLNYCPYLWVSKGFVPIPIFQMH